MCVRKNKNISLRTIGMQWHDKPLTYTFNVSRNTLVRIRLKWRPHIDMRTSI